MNQEKKSKRERFKNLFKSDKEIEEEEEQRRQELLKQQQIEQLPEEENQFIFDLKGGQIHTELLQAECTYNYGENQGLPVPLKCSWFIINMTENTVVPLQEITGAFYQPCIDDVNHKICLQATPILDDSDYVGMPLRKEVGPLALDPLIEEEAQERLEQGQATMTVTLIEIIDSQEQQNTIKLPAEIVLKIALDDLVIEYDNQAIYQSLLSENYPQISFQRKTATMFDVFEIQMNENVTLKIRAKSNKQRDVIAVAIRTFCGKKIMENQMQLEQTEENNNDTINIDDQQNDDDNNQEQNQNDDNEKNDEIQEQQENNDLELKNQTSIQLQESENNNNNIENQGESSPSKSSNVDIGQSPTKQINSGQQKPNYEVFVKLQQTTQKLNKIIKENESLQKQNKELKDDIHDKDFKIETLDEQLKNLSDNYFELQKSSQQSENSSSLTAKENHFLLQEVNFQITVVEDQKIEIENLKQEIEKFEQEKLEKQKQEYEKSKIPQIKQEDLDKLKQEISLLEMEKLTQKNEISELNTEISCLKQRCKGIQEEFEKSFDEAKFLRQKYKSLQKEKHMKFQIMNFEQDIKRDSENSNTESQSQYTVQSEQAEKTTNVSEFQPNSLQKSASNIYHNNNHNNNSSNPSSISPQKHPQSANNLDQYMQRSEADRDYEIANQKSKIQVLEATLDSMKQAYDRDISNKKKKKREKKSQSAEHYLSKLANKLAEAVTDKEIALENQRRVNKELVKKIKNCEQYLIQHDIQLDDQNLLVISSNSKIALEDDAQQLQDKQNMIQEQIDKIESQIEMEDKNTDQQSQQQE